MFSKKEIVHLLISILLLGFVFGFDDGAETFVASKWILNLIRVSLLVAVSVLLRELAIKLNCKRHDSSVEYEIWFMQRFWFGTKNFLKPAIPFGVIVAFLGAFISKGKFLFTALGCHNIQGSKARIGRKKIFLGDSENGFIVLSGIFVNIVLMYLGFLFNFGQLSTINFFLVLYNLIPFSRLDGAKIFFGSQLLWLFTFTFVVLSYYLLKISFVLGLTLGIIFGVVFVVWYYFKYLI